MADNDTNKTSSTPGPAGSSGKGRALETVAVMRDKAAGWLLLAPGEVNSFVGTLSRSTLAWTAIVLGAVILLSVNIIASTVFKGSSADLTANGLYTISDSTKRVLGKLEEPIDLKIYYSAKLGEASPVYKRYFERVRALIDRYASMAGGKLKVAFIDPEPFSDAEDRAVSAGLQGIQLNTEGEKGYFGLVASNSTDQTETIALFSPQREAFLEYDVTKLVHKLASPKKMVVGLMTALRINGGFDMRTRQPTQPWQIINQINEFFTVEAVEQNATTIPENVEVLVLVQPNGMTAQAAYAVDQFALKGGRVLAFVDPVPDVARLESPTAGGGTINPELAKLLTAWGVQFDPKKIAGDIGTARRVQTGGPRPVVTEYVAWLALTEKANIESTDVVSDGVKVVNMVSTGFLEPAEKAKTKFQPILSTSNRAMVIDAEKLTVRDPDPVALLSAYKEGGKPLVIGARLTGEAVTAFPDGAPKATPKDGEKKDGAGGDATKGKPNGGATPADAKDKGTAGKKDAPKSLKTGKLNAIVVADTDFLFDQFWVETRQMFGQQVAMPTAHNAVLVVNMLENLSGGEALSGLRGRGVDNRPFETVVRIRRAAEKEFREREKALQEKLETLRKELAQVEQRGGAGGVVLSDEDKQAVERFKAEFLKTRKQLRDVKHALSADIERLEARLKFINIAAVPLLIGIGGFAFAAFRRRRRKSS